MRWCRSCVLPDSRPNLVIGPDGICNACHSHGTKRHIDWDQRAGQLRDVAAWAKAASGGYDCLIPVSGGKDSTWQTIRCLELGLRPLAVTWKTPARTAIGQRNLDNLISLGVDHIDYRIDPKVEARFMVKAFERFGSTAVPMHMALFNIPLTIAARFRIPLVVWGENSAFEYGSANDAHTGFRLDAEWLRTYGVTHGTTAADWVDDELSAKDLAAYFGPTEAELSASGVRAIFLGYYLPWDPEETRRVAALHGFEADTGRARTGYYDFADIDDDFISIHHWMKWYKFGFTRLFDNLSLEIRNGRMTREQAVEIIGRTGDQTPRDDIASFCAFAGIPSERFYGAAETFRNTKVWSRRPDGLWHIPDFLIKDWHWS
ncbi:N-acetyl sugar amidotransferase [Magnetospirillum sp. 15-1]|uniref:N-acetyl sugar amidotransferase n=1 Tax=Magnetospirillum sp. 15-1 TaxID=1979370 RepID=UPI000BBC71E2|nr:N-acetyl sugar amidotransferase [Magnetospirillum sp. 15-1]